MHRHPDILSIGNPIVNIGKLMPMSERGRTPFGQRMRDARRDAGLTQEQVCKALGIAQSTLSGLETTDSSSGRVAEFAHLYGVAPLWLATGAGDARDIERNVSYIETQGPPSDAQQVATIYENLSATERRRFLHLLAAAKDDPPVLGDNWGRLWDTSNKEQLVDETRPRRPAKKRRLG